MYARSFDGTGLWYEVEGPAAAPSLLFSNSLGTAGGMWDAQMETFAGCFRVIRYDTRGHGRSEAPPGPYGLDMLGHDALAVLDAAGVERAHVIGLSLGGMTGMWLGVHAPQRLDRLVLSNTSACMPPRGLWDGRIRTVERQGMDGLVDATVERWFSAGFRERGEAAIAPVRAMVRATEPAGYAGCCAAIRDMDQRGDIAAITAPTLIIAGSLDPATPVADAEVIRERIAGSRLVILEAAHLSNIEAAEAFNRTALAFLAG